MSTVRSSGFDVLIIGGGNAGYCAAHAAAQRGRSVLLLEAANESESGGNSFFTAGATRFPHRGMEDLKGFIEPDERHDRTVVPPYSSEDFAADMAKVTEGRNDTAMTRLLVDESASGVQWLARLGIAYRLMYERQAYKRPDGSFLFWGGLHVGNVDGGQGLIADHRRVAARLGVQTRYNARVTDLLMEGDRVCGVRLISGDEVEELGAESIVIAAGGFEANPEMRELYLGPGWSKARVRGTEFNRGELIEAALRVGAARGGDWSTCHSVQWDAFYPENESNRVLTNRLTRQSYPVGIVVDRSGQRFIDEGADFRNYTYAKYGRHILGREGSVAWQVFDESLRPLLRVEEYGMPGVSVVQADSLGELAAAAEIDPHGFEGTVHRYNEAIDRNVEFDPSIKDGRSAALTLPKSNWASPLETPPFYAYPVTCGITFTFGGLAGDADGRVLDEEGDPIPGLFVCGEALGGLFSGNYPGGSGLAAGIVFGRRSGNMA